MTSSLLSGLIRAGLLAASCAAVLPRGANAQLLGSGGAAVGVGATLESYRFDSPLMVGMQSVTLATSPFGVRVPVFRRLAISASGAYAQGIVTRADGTEARIDGLTDTAVRLDLSLGTDAVVLSGVGAVPTGARVGSLEEAEVAGVFAADLLPFRVSNWGAGGALGIGIGVARSFGGVGLGVSAGYSVAGEFQPVGDDDRQYRPGDELQLRVALDAPIGRSGKFSLAAGTRRYGEDALQGENLYRSGNRTSGMASLSFGLGAVSSAVLYGALEHRDRTVYLDGSFQYPPQDLVQVGAGLRLPLGAARLVPQVDARLYRRGDAVGQGYAAAFGAALELPFGGIMVTPAAKYRLGELVVVTGQGTGLTGTELGLTIRRGGRR